MNLMNMMKDEQLGVAILYNFIEAYGHVELDLLDVVLPLIYNDTFRETITEGTSLEEVITLCCDKDLRFKSDVLKSFDACQVMTSNAIGMGMINGYIATIKEDGKNMAKTVESPILAITEAKLLSQMLKGYTKKQVEGIFKMSDYNIVFLQRDSVGLDVDIEAFNALGNVVVYPNTLQQQVKERIKDATIVVTNKNQIGKEELEGSKVKLVTLTATGFNNIDIEYCKENNIQVRNVKGYSTDTVAQHTLTMALNLLEHIPVYDRYIKDGSYSKDGNFSYFNETFHDLSSLTWGVVGLGDIGKKVCDIVKVFGANVQYYSTSGNNSNTDYTQVDFDTLLKTSDIISLHCPLNEQTQNLFNRVAIAKMKSTAILVNVARGNIVDEQAVADAIKLNKLGGIGFDVFKEEPMLQTNPLLTLNNRDNVILTPHIAWASIESRTRCVEEVYKNIEAFLQNKQRNSIV